MLGTSHKIITFIVEYNVLGYKASVPRKARIDAPGVLHLLKIAAINEISNLSVKLFQQCHLKLFNHHKNPIWVQLESVACQNEQGQSEQFLTVIKEITDTKKTN